jgi:phage shock protein E
VKTKAIAAVLSLFGLLPASGCAKEAAPSESGYHKISAEEARRMMQETETYILLDVRTQEEFDAGHIEGAVLLPDYRIGADAEEALPDRDAVILVYCRSGRRSADAAKELAGMGYTQLYDFGGILDWPYETVVPEGGAEE